MQIIGPFYTRSTYTKEAVDLFIEKNGHKVKYYGFYQRKISNLMNIYRYYFILPTGQKKLYLFCPHFFLAVNRNHWNTFLLFYVFISKKISHWSNSGPLRIRRAISAA